MAGFIGSLIGSGLALLPLAAAVLLVRYRHHLQKLHRSAGRWSLVAAILLMLGAGVMLTYVGVGSWAVRALVWARGEIGPVGVIVFAVAALFVLARIVAGVASQPDEGTVMVALFAPTLFATFQTGVFAQVNSYLALAGQEIAAQIGHALGVS